MSQSLQSDNDDEEEKYWGAQPLKLNLENEEDEVIFRTLPRVIETEDEENDEKERANKSFKSKLKNEEPRVRFEILPEGSGESGELEESEECASGESSKTSFIEALFRGKQNQTVYENFYEPTISLQEDEHVPIRKKYRTAKDYTIRLNDTNAHHFADVSRVGWKGRVDYALAEYEGEMSRLKATEHEIQQNPNRLLHTALVTIVLLACSKNVPLNSFMYTELYLKSIKNEYGDRPQNIQNLLKYMRHLKKTKNYNWGEMMSHVETRKGLVITKITEEQMKLNRSLPGKRSLNKSKIPVREKEKVDKSHKEELEKIKRQEEEYEKMKKQEEEFEKMKQKKELEKMRRQEEEMEKMNKQKEKKEYLSKSPRITDFRRNGPQASTALRRDTLRVRMKRMQKMDESKQLMNTRSPVTSEMFRGNAGYKTTSTPKSSREDQQIGVGGRVKRQESNKQYIDMSSPITRDMFVGNGSFEDTSTPKTSKEAQPNVKKEEEEEEDTQYFDNNSLVISDKFLDSDHDDKFTKMS